jgi:hypothetical protein
VRKFRLADNTSPIGVNAELGELGIEIENYPLIEVWNQKEEIREFKFIAVDFQYSGLQIVSEIQLDEVPEDTEIDYPELDIEYLN